MKAIAQTWRLSSYDDPKDEADRRASKPNTREQDDFHYKVEIWNYTGASIEQTLAITISRNVAFAAYYAALQEFPDGLITLRHKEVILARYNARKH